MTRQRQRQRQRQGKGRQGKARTRQTGGAMPRPQPQRPSGRSHSRSASKTEKETSFRNAKYHTKVEVPFESRDDWNTAAVLLLCLFRSFYPTSAHPVSALISSHDRDKRAVLRLFINSCGQGARGLPYRRQLNLRCVCHAFCVGDEHAIYQGRCNRLAHAIFSSCRHRTAPHRIAPHRTAPHRTAPI